MKKGFTLVEFLAVLIILAVIASITTPIVFDLITDSKNTGLIESANSYIQALEYSIKVKNINEEFNPSTCVIQKEGNAICDGVLIEVEVSKNIPTGGELKLKNGVVDSVIDLEIDSKLLSTDSNKEFIIQ